MKTEFFNSKSVNIIKLFISIFLSLILIIGMSMAWIESAANPTVIAPSLQLAASPGLVMTIDGKQTDLISLNDYLIDNPDQPFILSEMSSQDGELMFVRMPDSSDNPAINIVKIRPADDSDKNVNYIHFNLKLTSDGVDRKIYLGDAIKTYLHPAEGGNANSVKPVRIYLSYQYNDDGIEISGKKIFCTEASGTHIAAFDFDQTNHDFIEEYCGDQEVLSFSTYFYDETTKTGKELFTLKSGITANITIKIWLEGCDVYCEDSIENGQISGSQLDFKLTFFTPRDEE